MNRTSKLGRMLLITFILSLDVTGWDMLTKVSHGGLAIAMDLLAGCSIAAFMSKWVYEGVSGLQYLRIFNHVGFASLSLTIAAFGLVSFWCIKTSDVRVVMTTASILVFFLTIVIWNHASPNGHLLRAKIFPCCAGERNALLTGKGKSVPKE